MKNTILYILLLSTLAPASLRANETDYLLAKLDSLITHKEDFALIKEKRIDELRRKKSSVATQEEQYWLNKMFYDEYFVYNADSAMAYIEQNLRIATQLNKPQWHTEWRIKKSFVLSATGLLKEAFDELKGIYGKKLTPQLRTEYYGQMIYLYSHLGLYSGDNELAATYYLQETAYKDSIYAVISPGDPSYLWHRGWKFLGTSDAEPIKRVLKERMLNSNLDSRQDAMEAYLLSHLCKTDKEDDDFIRYLVYSAMADVRISNKDIASLEELGKILFERGDIDRAYNYINFCLQSAQLYHNRVRVVGISKTQNAIHQAYQERNVRQQARVQLFLILISILSVVLIAALFYIYRQMRKLSHSGSKLDKANHLLNQHVEELSQAQQQLAQINDELQSVNKKLKEANSQLQESNYVKEEYIGYVFTLCSNYISKLDEFRKNINRKIKTKQYDEIKTFTDTPTIAQNELKEFYNNFDAIFLNVYPNFVNDFNTLLQPEGRITPKEGELLNTELRIYALVRLGINDSVKIAEFLHCSPQTVYNNRLRTRNKAVIAKEEFAKTVQALGKHYAD